jgi:hypothetical protein
MENVMEARNMPSVCIDDSEITIVSAFTSSSLSSSSSLGCSARHFQPHLGSLRL